MSKQIKKLWEFVKSLPSGAWIALVALTTYMALTARKTASEVVEIERQRTKELKLQNARATKIKKSLERTKKQVEKETEELEKETLAKEKEVAEAATSMKKTVDLVNDTFGE
jgi:hypothetical protein